MGVAREPFLVTPPLGVGSTFSFLEEKIKRTSIRLSFSYAIKVNIEYNNGMVTMQMVLVIIAVEAPV